MSSFDWLIPELSNAQWLIHAAIFTVNFLLFLFAKPILNFIDSEGESESKIRILRSLNVLVMVLQLIDLVLLRANSDYENYFINAGQSVMVIYAGLLIYSTSSLFLRKKFGDEKVLDDKKIFIETYSSRLVDIVLLVFIIISTVYWLIIIWGANSLLETTGILGIIVAFMAFTSNIWAPDIISGLIILNTKMLEDGDVVVIDGYKDEYIINKVTFIYVILYDIRNNHRTLIRNNRFIHSKIDNLSRIASTDGIRQKHVYNIAYPAIGAGTAEARLAELDKHSASIAKMFDRAFEACCNSDEIKINRNKPFEWSLTQTGNYALEYSLWIYLERIPNTKVTATIRKHLMRTMFRINELVFRAAIAEGIDLATPDLNTTTLLSAPPLPAPYQQNPNQHSAAATTQEYQRE